MTRTGDDMIWESKRHEERKKEKGTKRNLDTRKDVLRRRRCIVVTKARVILTMETRKKIYHKRKDKTT